MRKKRQVWKLLPDLVWEENVLQGDLSSSPWLTLQATAGSLPRPWARCHSQVSPQRQLCCPHPRRRGESGSSFCSWQRNDGYEDPQVLETWPRFSWKVISCLSPWNLERMSWILCSHQAREWLYPEGLTSCPWQGHVPPYSGYRNIPARFYVQNVGKDSTHSCSSEPREPRSVYWNMSSITLYNRIT